MKGDDKRHIILKATMELITEHGFHATPMSMIAKQAGVAAGTIYNYFPSKEVLINQLYGELRQKMEIALLRNETGSGNIRERFFLLYYNLFEHFTQNQEEFLFLEQYANSPLILRNQHAYGPHFNQSLIDFLTGGMELGVLRSMDIELMTAIVYGHVASTAKLHLSGSFPLDEKHLEQAVQSSWDSVKIT